VDVDRGAGTFMCAGGIIGLAGTISTVFPFSVLGVISFGLVLAFGGFVSRKRAQARLLASATLWFALLGGAASATILWFAQVYQSNVWLAQGSVGLVGAAIALTGAVIKHRGVRT